MTPDGGEVTQYLNAIKEGNVEPLEELAISAGYTQSYEGLRTLEKGREKLNNGFYRARNEKNSLYAAHGADECWEVVMPSAFPTLFWVKYRSGREHWNIPSDQQLREMNSEESDEHINRYLGGVKDEINRGTNLFLKQNEGFVRTREGLQQDNSSVISYVTNSCWLGGGLQELKPEDRKLFVDIFDKEPLWEGVLGRGLHTASCEKEEDTYGRSQRAESDLNTRIANKTENLIHGMEAVRYLIGLRDGERTDLFPLSKLDYGDLISFQKKNIRNIKSVRRMMLQKVEAGWFLPHDKDFELSLLKQEHEERMEEERAHLNRLEEAASKL